MSISNQDKVKKMKRLKSVIEGGEIAILEYLVEIEQKIDEAMPAFNQIIEQIRGKDGVDYVITDDDKKEIVNTVNLMISRQELVYEILNNIDYQKIANLVQVSPGAPGKTPTTRELLALIEPLMPDTTDIASIASQMAIEELKGMIPGDQEDDIELDPEEVKNSLESLEGDDRLNYTAIKGLENLLKNTEVNGKEIRIGGPNGIFIHVDGVKKGIVKSLNFKAGTGITLSVSKINGLDTITIAAAGGGVSFETPVGSINSSNVTFTVTNNPKAVILNGIWYFENDGYTYVSGTKTITMLITPVTGSTFKSVY